MPDSSARSRSSFSALAVTATIFVSQAGGSSSRIRRVAAKPSISGM